MNNQGIDCSKGCETMGRVLQEMDDKAVRRLSLKYAKRAAYGIRENRGCKELELPLTTSMVLEKAINDLN